MRRDERFEAVKNGFLRIFLQWSSFARNVLLLYVQAEKQTFFQVQLAVRKQDRGGVRNVPELFGKSAEK